MSSKANETIKVKSPKCRILKIKPISIQPQRNPVSKPSVPSLSFGKERPSSKDITSLNTKRSTLENSKSRSKDKKRNTNGPTEQKYLSSLYNKYNYLQEKLNKNNVVKILNKTQLLTPIPSVKKIQNKVDGKLMNDAIKNAIILRRLEYNEYIKNSKNLKKPRRQIKNKKKIELIRKPSFDEDKVVEIQKVFKGYSTRVVNKSIIRLKIRTCLLETFCLICRKNYYSALKRVTLGKLKTLYYYPFIGINNEMSFRDKLQVKLANRYYNFVQFKDLNKTIE